MNRDILEGNGYTLQVTPAGAICTRKVSLLSTTTSKIVPLASATKRMAQHETDKGNEKSIKKKETQITKTSKLI